MCGIAVAVGSSDTATVRAMLDRLAHRGPDGQAVCAGDGIVLGHRRLAIMDPEGGRQPLTSGGAALVANGMIYNDRMLRRRLGSDRFRTGSDSESILHARVRFGPAADPQLDGMFAYVLAGRGGVVAARDPIGIKPLYAGRRDRVTYLASEIKALAGIADGIHPIPPGHSYRVGGEVTPYYHLPHPRPATLDPDTAVRAVRQRLERAVVRRLRSDVPLGCFLSGGLDSSAIAAVAARHVPHLHTFSVGLAGSADLAAARAVAEHLGTVHHEEVVDPQEVLVHLPRILHHLESCDPDLVRSAVPTWFVARAAARHVKVVLTGEGADELFGGYRYHGRFGRGRRLQAELRRSVAQLHALNLQRVDRMTMAHGLEARVPFLDTAMIDLAMRVAPEHKRPAWDGRTVEKWVLRQAVADLLPDRVAWRGKAQFADGSGFGELLADNAAWAEGDRDDPDAAQVRLYRRLLADGFPDPAAVLALTERWRGATPPA